MWRIDMDLKVSKEVIRYNTDEEYRAKIKQKNLTAYKIKAQSPDFRAKEAERQKNYRMKVKSNPELLEKNNKYFRNYQRKAKNIPEELWRK